MPGRLPTQADFHSATVSIIPPPSTHNPTNVLLLLHGLGDTQLNFASFAGKLALPETCCIALRAPAPLPFDLEGYHWGDDIVFDNATGGLDADSGFKKALNLVLENIVRRILIGKCGYKGREIIFFGFGQGGMLALSLAKEMEIDELGGVVSVGGALPASMALATEGKKSKTPVVICKASNNSAVKDKDVQRLRDSFEFLELNEWKRNGDGMPEAQKRERRTQRKRGTFLRKRDQQSTAHLKSSKFGHRFFYMEVEQILAA
ncbi:phospholipase/Carboxylesterase superfamily protein [Venturia nashicola]|nr:phospholipase/Carboxylesterase superfamily protein [Venturia nashicola]